MYLVASELKRTRTGEHLAEGVGGEKGRYARCGLTVLRWAGKILVATVAIALLIAMLFIQLFHSGPS